MKTRHDTPAKAGVSFSGLSGEQRVLVEQVSGNGRVFDLIRKRARALLLLDQGAPLAQVESIAALDRRTVRSLIHRHSLGGVCAALLGCNPPSQKRHWLALSSMHR